jgi:hypothetical protein
VFGNRVPRPLRTGPTSLPEPPPLPAARRTGRRALGAAAAGLCAVALLAGCDPSGGSAEGGSGAVPSGTPAPPHLPGVAVVVCLDTSASYAPAHRRAAERDVAAALPRLVVAGHRAGTVYVYRISANSFDKAPDLTVAVPALRPEPARTGKAAPLQDGTLAEQRATLHRRWADERDTARGTVRRAARKLTALRLPTAQGTDIGGCLQNASDQFAAPANAGRTRHLVIASDLQPHGRQQLAHAALHGVAVDVVEYACSKAGSCATRAAAFRRELRTMGAGPVRITRPGIRPTLFTAGDR